MVLILKKNCRLEKDNPNLFVMCDGDDVRRDVLPLKGDSSSVVKVSNFSIICS